MQILLKMIEKNIYSYMHVLRTINVGNLRYR